jgi:hypothetical protein
MRVLLVASTTGYQTRSFYDAAKKLNIELVLATDRCHVLEDPWGDSAVALRFEDPTEGIESLSERGPFEGIVAVGDKPAYVAALAAKRFGLNFSPPSAVLAARNKFLARERFRANGLLNPGYQLFQEPVGSVRYPCVLKPLGLSGSRGVIRANNSTEFAAAFARIRSIAADPSILVEDFLPGHEYALEGIVTDGRLKVLALFDKPDPLDGPFFEETIYVTVPIQEAIVETAQRAITALGLTHGPIHAEMRVNHDGVWMLEVAARPIGGLCSRVLRLSASSGTNLSLEEILLRHAVGGDINDVRLVAGAHSVMMIPIPRGGIYQYVQKLDHALAVEHVEDVVITAKQGQAMIPLPEGASYLGFIFARAGSSDNAVKAIREAYARLEFKFDSILPVVR